MTRMNEIITVWKILVRNHHGLFPVTRLAVEPNSRVPVTTMLRRYRTEPNRTAWRRDSSSILEVIDFNRDHATGYDEVVRGFR